MKLAVDVIGWAAALLIIGAYALLSAAMNVVWMGIGAYALFQHRRPQNKAELEAE
jgi:hypothetical protein